jgi:hypothetical protein
MSMINIIYGNHKNYVGVQDHIQYFSEGLISLFSRVEINESNWFSNAINVIVEGNDNNYYSQLIDLKRQTPQSKFLVVVTEIVGEGRFNSANTNKTSLDDHYDNKNYWQARYQDFESLLPFVDGFVCVSEVLLDGYKKFNRPLFYLPMACPSTYPKLQRAPVERQYIDILFSGTVTPYRKLMIDELTQRGFRVKITSPATTDFYREYFHKHSKLVIGPRLDIETKLISKMRAYYVLSRQVPHLFELTPDMTDLHPHIDFCSDNDKFIDECIEKIKQSSLKEEKFKRYTSDPNLNHGSIFKELYSFIRNL